MDILGPQNISGQIQQAESQATANKVRNLASGAEAPQTLEGLEKAAKEFEGVFLNNLMKAMRKTVPDNKLFNSEGPTKFYQQMHDAEMAKAMASGHSRMGIADMIVRQFKSNLEAAEGESSELRTPPAAPLPPVAMDRYRSMSAVTGNAASLARLKVQAADQGAAVADTLQRFGSDIVKSAEINGVDPALVLAVVMQESGGDPLARSPKGAQGLMQLMPETARDLGVRDVSSPSQNLAGGSRYLSRMLQRYDGNLELALAAYNAGPGNVDQAGRAVPDFRETRNYVARVQELYQELGGTIMANGKPSKPVNTISGE